MTIRSATAADVPQIAAIWNQVIRETTVTFTQVEKSDAEVADAIKDDCLVWTKGARIVGFARYFPFRGGEGYQFTIEHSIMLHADGQGQGLGTQLMQALCAHAKAAGKRTMIAGCSAENTGALAFHAKLGFAKVATLPDVGFKFGRWIDLVLLQKTL